MRLERSTGAVLIEAAMFAVMAGIVGMTAFMVLGDRTFVEGAMFGAAVGAVVFLVMWLLMRGTMEPPRGPGNIKQSETPITKGVAGASKPTVPKKMSKPATASASKPAASRSTATRPAASQAVDTASDAAGKPAPHIAATAPEAYDTSPAEITEPQRLKEPRSGGPDDLKRIRGVGPKLEDTLHSMGFYHLDQIANWSAAEVAWVDENLIGFKGRVSRDEWVMQAKALAEGEETEFSKRVDDGEVY